MYAFGALSRAPESRWAAALLAAGDGSALGRTAAAAFYGQLPVRGVIDVIELDTEQTHGTAWKRRDDASRDAYLSAKGKIVRRVRRGDWDRAELEAWLRAQHSVRPTDVFGPDPA